jgi:uncharacterized protein YukJ
MSLTYGFVKCKIVSKPVLKSSRHKQEIQYHLHATLSVPVSGGGAPQKWDSAVNVGTNDADDLLRYRLVFDYHHPLLETLRAADAGFNDLTDTDALPALDFLRSNVLDETGSWRDSGVMDGSADPEPVASLKKLLTKAQTAKADVYIFGRAYTDGSHGVHDVHMNQGSSGSFLNNGKDDHNDHNQIWQDGAVIVDFGDTEATAYFTAFTQQMVPTDDLGNPEKDSHEIEDADDGSLAKVEVG